NPSCPTQSPHTTSFGSEARAVRSTVRLEVVHALQDRRVDRAAQTDRAYDPAHGACSSCLGVRIRRYPRGWVARLSPGEIVVTSITQEACRIPSAPPAHDACNSSLDNGIARATGPRRVAPAGNNDLEVQNCGRWDTARQGSRSAAGAGWSAGARLQRCSTARVAQCDSNAPMS